ncbi:unnamed protein product [Linum trigynum]|uniref:Uncharacterized protein n=1 Tax=Linum trigynum TaxID=586398 RepID=A0AAV2ECT2_9ROSI
MSEGIKPMSCQGSDRDLIMEARLRASTSSSQDKVTRSTPTQPGIEAIKYPPTPRRDKGLQGDGYQPVNKTGQGAPRQWR